METDVDLLTFEELFELYKKMFGDPDPVPGTLSGMLQNCSLFWKAGTVSFDRLKFPEKKVSQSQSATREFPGQCSPE